MKTLPFIDHLSRSEFVDLVPWQELWKKGDTMLDGETKEQMRAALGATNVAWHLLKDMISLDYARRIISTRCMGVHPEKLPLVNACLG